MSRFELKRVGPNDVDVVHDILRRCGEDMKERLGFTHWIPPYPLRLMRQSTLEKQVYAVVDGELVVATFTLGTLTSSYYDQLSVLWESPQAKALYLNRLAVLPHLQGQGIGSWCLRHIEQFALEDEDCAAIRFDAYAEHKRLLDFYQKAGYAQKGRFTVSTSRRGVNDVICFEKVRRHFLSV